MELIELKASVREKTGKGPGRVLRGEGRVPAVLYGPGAEPLNLSVAVLDLQKILREGNQRHILKLMIQNGGETTRSAMIKELQTEPVSRDLVHVDFYEIAMDRKISVHVFVEAVGDSVGVKAGGVLQVVRRELEVYCLPGRIPESITVDITDLGVGDSVHVEDIPLPEGVEVPHDVNFTVLTIAAPTREETEGEAEVEEELEAGEAPEGTGEAPKESA